MAISNIVSFPINSMVIFHSYVKRFTRGPEGSLCYYVDNMW